MFGLKKKKDNLTKKYKVTGKKCNTGIFIKGGKIETTINFNIKKYTH